MKHPFLPIVIHPSLAARRLLGPAVEAAAGLALRTLLRERRSLEIAHQQVVFRSQPLAFSSRVSAQGDLIVEIDVGDPRLADRVILEEDLRKASFRDQGARPAPKPRR